MTTWRQVVDTHRANPELNAIEIGAALGCCPGYVRATARRRKLMLPKALRGPQSTHRASLSRRIKSLEEQVKYLRVQLSQRMQHSTLSYIPKPVLVPARAVSREPSNLKPPSIAQLMGGR